MSVIKGSTKIELFDKDGNVTSVVQEDNFITNAIKDIYDGAMSLDFSPLNVINNQIKSYTLGDFFGIDDIGVAVLNRTLPNDESFTVLGEKPNAYAGGEYVGNDTDRGTLNINETSVYEEGGKIKHRWVWDFPTSSANMEIKSICLVPRACGNGVQNAEIPVKPLNKNNNIGLQGYGENEYTFYSDNTYQFTKIDEIVKPTSNGYALYKCNYTLSYGKNLRNIKTLDVVLSDYTDFHKQVCIDKDNNIYLLAKKVSDTKYYVIKLSYGTDSILQEILLPNVNSKPSFFGVVSDAVFYKVRLISEGGQYTKIALGYVTFTGEENEVVCQGGIGNYTSTDVRFTISTYVDSQGNMNMYFGHIQRYNATNAANKYGVSVHSTNNYYYYNECSGVNSYTKLHGFNKINNTLFGYATHSKDSNSWYTLYPAIHNTTLFTINNLDNPIPKTEANTMKITYILTFDKEN